MGFRIFFASVNVIQARELEIEIYWNDWRCMCAFTTVRLGDLIFEHEHERAGTVLQMEPHGELFVEVGDDKKRRKNCTVTF